MAPGEKLTFRSRHRLRHAREFAAVYDARVRKSRGPLTLFTLPNDLKDHRLGLAVGVSVGNAVARNRIKRLLREAFRLERAGFPLSDDGYLDLLITVKPHKPMTLAEYRGMLVELMCSAATEWSRRAKSRLP